MDPYSRKAITIAEERSAQYESDRIDCHHLLHALAQTGRGVAATVLADAGLDLAAL
ncbi:Clp protease N-terminal domain-containing protein [Streptomyces sp. NPDC005407]|uniref:Clp protease N-terminal domain-containing protein n=1 Tax=Streptomyces sp. NPDC005407 TaxID=3155340 RepID=UPI0033B8D983